MQSNGRNERRRTQASGENPRCNKCSRSFPVRRTEGRRFPGGIGAASSRRPWSGHSSSQPAFERSGRREQKTKGNTSAQSHARFQTHDEMHAPSGQPLDLHPVGRNISTGVRVRATARTSRRGHERRTLTFVASCLRGAFPPVDLRAVCFVRACS